MFNCDAVKCVIRRTFAFHSILHHLTTSGKKILSLPEEKDFPYHGKCQSRGVCLQKQQDLDTTHQAVAVSKGRKEIGNAQESPHPLLEENPICSVLKGRNKVERTWC